MYGEKWRRIHRVWLYCFRQHDRAWRRGDRPAMAIWNDYFRRADRLRVIEQRGRASAQQEGLG